MTYIFRGALFFIHLILGFNVRLCWSQLFLPFPFKKNVPTRSIATMVVYISFLFCIFSWNLIILGSGIGKWWLIQSLIDLWEILKKCILNVNYTFEDSITLGSYNTIPSLETIQLKWSRSTNKNILVSFSSYFFLGGWNSVVLLKHWISCKNREKPTEIPVADQPQYGFEYFLSLYCPKTSKNNIGKYG